LISLILFLFCSIEEHRTFNSLGAWGCGALPGGRNGSIGNTL
jgi:hypothetical protein